MLLFIVFIVTIYCIAFNRETLIRNVKILIWSHNLPGPIAILPIGCAYKFICKREEIFNRIRGIMDDFPYPIVKIWMGPKLLLMINEPQYLEEILKSTRLVEKDALLAVAKPFVGDGLITGTGSKQKANKKVIMPTLNIRAVDSYYNIFHNGSMILVEKLMKIYNDDSKSNEIMLEDYLHTCAIDVVGETIMGIKLQTQSSVNEDFMESLFMMYFIVIERMVKPWLYPDILFKCSKLYNVQNKAIKILREFIADVIQEKKDEGQVNIMKKVIDSKTKTEETIDDAEEKISKTMLEQLIDAKYKNTLQISDDEMIDETLTIFMASSDTMAQIGCFCLKMLAMHPEHQERIVEEFLDITNNFEKPLDPSTCSKLVYLDRCIKETLRLFPIAPFLVRINRENFKVSPEVEIPAGVTVLMNLFKAHRDPRYWSNPEEFHPDHFLPEYVSTRHPYAFLPFSSGVRGCIGKVYAIISIKIMVVRVLQKLKVSCGPNEPTVKNMLLSSDISVRATHGNTVILSLRN